MVLYVIEAAMILKADLYAYASQGWLVWKKTSFLYLCTCHRLC